MRINFSAIDRIEELSRDLPLYCAQIPMEGMPGKAQRYPYWLIASKLYPNGCLNKLDQ